MPFLVIIAILINCQYIRNFFQLEANYNLVRSNIARDYTTIQNNYANTYSLQCAKEFTSKVTSFNAEQTKVASINPDKALYYYTAIIASTKGYPLNKSGMRNALDQYILSFVVLNEDGYYRLNSDAKLNGELIKANNMSLKEFYYDFEDKNIRYDIFRKYKYELKYMLTSTRTDISTITTTLENDRAKKSIATVLTKALLKNKESLSDISQADIHYTYFPIYNVLSGINPLENCSILSYTYNLYDNYVYNEAVLNIGGDRIDNEPNYIRVISDNSDLRYMAYNLYKYNRIPEGVTIYKDEIGHIETAINEEYFHAKGYNRIYYK